MHYAHTSCFSYSSLSLVNEREPRLHGLLLHRSQYRFVGLMLWSILCPVDGLLVERCYREPRCALPHSVLGTSLSRRSKMSVKVVIGVPWRYSDWYRIQGDVDDNRSAQKGKRRAGDGGVAQRCGLIVPLGTLGISYICAWDRMRLLPAHWHETLDAENRYFWLIG